MKTLTDLSWSVKNKFISFSEFRFTIIKIPQNKRTTIPPRNLNPYESVLLTPPHLLALFELQSCFGYGNYFESKLTEGLSVDELQRLLEEMDFLYTD